MILYENINNLFIHISYDDEFCKYVVKHFGKDVDYDFIFLREKLKSFNSRRFIV